MSFQESPVLLGHLHRVDREHTAVVEVQCHDLEHVARPVRPQAESANRRLGVDVIAENGVSDRVPDVGIRNPMPSGTGVDPDITHSNIVLRKGEGGRGTGSGSAHRRMDVRDPLVVAAAHTRTASRRMCSSRSFRPPTDTASMRPPRSSSRSPRPGIQASTAAGSLVPRLPTSETIPQAHTRRLPFADNVSMPQCSGRVRSPRPGANLSEQTDVVSAGPVFDDLAARHAPQVHVLPDHGTARDRYTVE